MRSHMRLIMSHTFEGRVVLPFCELLQLQGKCKANRQAPDQKSTMLQNFRSLSPEPMGRHELYPLVQLLTQMFLQEVHSQGPRLRCRLFVARAMHRINKGMPGVVNLNSNVFACLFVKSLNLLNLLR